MSSASFNDFALSKPLLTALAELGYETPSPVQAESIPILLEGRDLIAQAQTGTGKTAAFALPVLEKLDLKKNKTQALILAPTRELAIQVAEALQSYSKHLPDFHIAPIYGGQSYTQQLRALKRGVHVVVGTPGRVMDHMRRETLSLKDIKTLVLDEADEMLRMGFIDDVKWILEHMPHEHQTALFSATMPSSIQQVAKAHLNNPAHVKVKSKTMTAAGVSQSAMIISGKNKMEALTRYLALEEFDGAIIFARTKNLTTELAEKLLARGYSAAALNGDMNQRDREKVIERVKNQKLDIIVATDVAARGLDVERLSHVINYDSPHDPETYVHRIGRTGRAGREGKSLLMLSPRERHHLRSIERTTKQTIEVITPPSIKVINQIRAKQFTEQLANIISKSQLDHHREIIQKIAHDTESSELDIAAALMRMFDPLKEIKGEDKPLLEQNDRSDRGGEKRRERPRRSRSNGNRSESSDRRRSDSRDGAKRFSKSKSSGEGRRSDSKRGDFKRGEDKRSEGKRSGRANLPFNQSEKRPTRKKPSRSGDSTLSFSKSKPKTKKPKRK
jgi:ATP-dependent RNA helicase DeaD